MLLSDGCGDASAGHVLREAGDCSATEPYVGGAASIRLLGVRLEVELDRLAFVQLIERGLVD